MNMKFFALIAVVGLSVTACGPRKAAYSDINTNQPAKVENQSSATTSQTDQTNSQAPPTGDATQAPPSQPAPAPLSAFRMPAFMDTTKGYPKDLPNYPVATTGNKQYGPN